MKELESALAKIPLLQSLPRDEHAALLGCAHITKAPNGRFLSRAGSETKEVAFIVEGSARLCQSDANGKEVTIALLGPGAHIGVVSLLTDAERLTDVIATGRSTLLCFDAAAFHRQLQRSPVLSYRMLVSLARRLSETSRHLSEASLYDLNRRLALRLLELADVVDWNGEERLLVRQRPSHQELANMLGVSREAVTRALKSLEEKGHIEVADDQVFVTSTPL